MKYIREICVAGGTIDVLYKVPSVIEKGMKRAPKSSPTPEDVQKINDKNAEKDLARILNHNFKPGDWHLVLTYSGKEPTSDQARKDLTKFKRDLNNEFGNLKSPLKWVSVTEYMHDRIHHHIVCSYIEYKNLIALWSHGDVRPTIMKRHRNYRRLANYLIKETTKTYRLPDSVTKRRYSCSRSIERPEVKREYVSPRELEKDPKPYKGYYIDSESIRRGEHEVTGYPYLEYTMVTIEEEPRIKKWYKGKRLKARENYNYILRGFITEEQLSINN